MPTYHRTYALACSCGDTVDAPNVEAAVAMDEPYPCIPHGLEADIGGRIGATIEDEDGNVVYTDGGIADEMWGIAAEIFQLLDNPWTLDSRHDPPRRVKHDEEE